MSNAIDQKQQMLAKALCSSDEGTTKAVGCHDYLSQAEVNVLSSMPGALAMVAGNGMQVWSNMRARSLVGDDPNWLDRINPQDKVEAFQAISSAARDGIDTDITIKVSQPTALSVIETKILQLKCKSFAPSEQLLEDPFALVTIEDLTLHSDVKRQLAEAQKENEDKNHFFSSMSHELRTPLNAIIGFAELLEGKAAVRLDDARRLEYAGLISGSASHLLGLINDILDLSRLDAGKSEIRKEPIDIHKSLDTTARSMMPIAMDKRVDLIIEDAADIPQLHTDGRALTQILTNLLSNAIKFSHENGAVRAKIVRLRNRVKITVSDDGIGMDTETQSKLGGLFYQSGDVIRGAYGGSGLGLSIVYKLVELLGGKIAINSQLGKGTMVSVILPMGTDGAMPIPAASDEVVYLSGLREKRSEPCFEKKVYPGVNS